MKSPHTDEGIESLDRKSSRAICDAVGERLQQVLRPESTRTPSHLQHLVDELQKHDGTDGSKSH